MIRSFVIWLSASLGVAGTVATTIVSPPHGEHAGLLAVALNSSSRPIVQLLTIDGEVLDSFLVPADFISDVAFHPTTGDLYVLTDSGVMRRSPTGVVANLGLCSAGPYSGADMAVSAQGTIAVALEEDSATILLYGADGSFMEKLPLPEGVFVVDVTFDSVSANLFVYTDRGMFVREPDGAFAKLGSVPRLIVNRRGDIAISPLGGLVISPRIGGDILFCDQEGNLEEQVTLPVETAIHDMAFDQQSGDLLVLTESGIVRRTQRGQMHTLPFFQESAPASGVRFAVFSSPVAIPGRSS